MPYCTSCGTEIAAGQTSCPKCGEELRNQTLQDTSKSGLGNRVSGLSGDPLPPQTRNALLGILLGIIFFGVIQIGIAYGLGLFDQFDNQPTVAFTAYLTNVILDIVVLGGAALILAKLNLLFDISTPPSGLTAASKNAFLGVVAGNVLLWLVSQSGTAQPTLTPNTQLLISLFSLVLYPIGVVLSGYLGSKQRIL